MVEDTDSPFEREQSLRDETVRMLSRGQKVFNRYTLARILGRGGMGVVWLARDGDLDRNVALKFLPESVAHDAEAAADLKRETRRSLELTHPNIVRIYDFVHDEHYAAIAMEHIDGRSLSALKAEKPNGCFEVEEIRSWVQQLCAALDYAHGHGKLAHQDLKPANLMVNSKGQLKVTDFGIARSIADSVTRITADDTIGGTLVYMSPQQLNGQKPSPSNDIYSVGATIYDLLTGKPPFYTGALAHQIEKNDPPRMAQRRAELEVPGQPIPEEWEETILASLAKTPEDRPASAAELAQRLGLHTSASDAAWMTRLPGRTDQVARAPLRRGLLIAGVGAGLCLVAAIVYLAFFRTTAADQTAAGGGSGSAGATPGAARPGVPLPAAIPLADLGRVFTNQLGMVFREVKPGELFFSVWETRVRDFRAFTKATGHNAKAGVISMKDGEFSEFGHHWEAPGWEQTDDHPAVGLNRFDGTKFCEWLTQQERELGRVPEGFEYRLPTDQEWSYAAGLTDEPGARASERDGRVTDHYPWGTAWPPPSLAGNYAAGDDGYPFTAPVGRFPPNEYGLHDLGGNAWEWCLDAYDDQASPTESRGVLRGASYMYSMTEPGVLLTSRRRDPTWSKPGVRNIEMGFRCVLARPPGVPPPTPMQTTAVRVPDLGQHYTNDLGMAFVRVDVLYWSIWETRRTDFEAFASDTQYDATTEMWYYNQEARDYVTTPGVDWRNPSFTQEPDHPVVGVSRLDAEAFCEWLTRRARAQGTLPPGCLYRLPTDLEWSHAVGLEQEPGAMPADRDSDNDRLFPWGTIWPPPEMAGNYLDVGDAYPQTAPVGRFQPNRHGLYDMGGNVWEWCQDWYDQARQSGVLRGGSFRISVKERDLMLASRRNFPSFSQPYKRNFTFGFRCVLAGEPVRNAASAK
jgi:formylglycine-generating enzyme required for sulfatase activity